METVAAAETKHLCRDTSLRALGLYPCWKRIKSFEKSKTAIFISLNSTDDSFCLYSDGQNDCGTNLRKASF